MTTSCKCPGQSDSGFAFTYFLRFCVDLTGACPNSDGRDRHHHGVASKTGGPGGTPLGTPTGTRLPHRGATWVSARSTVYQFTSTNSANLILTFDETQPRSYAPLQVVEVCEPDRPTDRAETSAASAGSSM